MLTARLMSDVCVINGKHYKEENLNLPIII